MNVWLIQDGESLPQIDGNNRPLRTALLANALCDRGHDVLWWASTFNHALKTYRFDHQCTVELRPQLRVCLLHGPGYGSNKSVKRILHHLTLADQFRNEAARLPLPDLILGSIPTLELAEQAVIIGRAAGIPVLVDIRDAWPDHYLSLAPKTARRVLRQLLVSEFRRMSRIVQQATGIIAISRSYMQWALQYAGRTQRSWDAVYAMGYPSLDARQMPAVAARREELFSTYGLSSDEMIVTFVGSLTTSFRLDVVMEAARRLAESRQAPTRFVIVGEGGEGRKLRILAKDLKNVTFTGWLDQISIAAILGFSSVGLAPYTSDSLITLPNKPFEYMAAGLPLLSSLSGELEELIHNEQIGLRYEADDVDSLVEKICWFSANPRARQEMGQRACMLFADRFSAEVVYPQMAKHMEMVAQAAVLRT